MFVGRELSEIVKANGDFLLTNRFSQKGDLKERFEELGKKSQDVNLESTQ